MRPPVLAINVKQLDNEHDAFADNGLADTANPLTDDE
jgi:hypothetical protein